MVFGVEDIMLNFESVLNVVINEYFGLKVVYNVIWNFEFLEFVLEYIDCWIILLLGYSM